MNKMISPLFNKHCTTGKWRRKKIINKNPEVEIKKLNQFQHHYQDDV